MHAAPGVVRLDALLRPVIDRLATDIAAVANGRPPSSQGDHMTHGPNSFEAAVERYTGEATARLVVAAPDLYAALTDMLAGWQYIREHHGDLYGVGWDRCQQSAEAALAKARGEAA